MLKKSRGCVYPGTFDPITLGHMDIISKISEIFGYFTIAIVNRTNKNVLFSPEERRSMVQKAIEQLGCPAAEVVVFGGLLTEFAKDINASCIIRGIRTASDFDYEFQMSWINSKLCPSLGTILIPASENTQFISSSAVKEIAKLKGELSTFVPKYVQDALMAKYA